MIVKLPERKKPRKQVSGTTGSSGADYNEDLAKRRRFVNGVWFPTDAEIEEGKAFRKWLMEPDDPCLEKEHTIAWNRMMSIQKGDVGLLRCGRCQVIKWGRRKDDPCGVCGSRSGYYENG